MGLLTEKEILSLLNVELKIPLFSCLQKVPALKVGAQLAVCVSGDQLILVEETYPVGRMKTPPADLLAAVRSAGGYAFGQIKQIHPLSGTADVEID